MRNRKYNDVVKFLNNNMELLQKVLDKKFQVGSGNYYHLSWADKNETAAREDENFPLAWKLNIENNVGKENNESSHLNEHEIEFFKQFEDKYKVCLDDLVYESTCINIDMALNILEEEIEEMKEYFN